MSFSPHIPPNLLHESNCGSRDSLYARHIQPLPRFAFDEQVAQVFPDMIQRSVPGYAAILNMLGIFAAHYVQPHSTCYDLGCSLGAATLAVWPHLPPTATLIAADNSEAMLKQCRVNLAQAGVDTQVQVINTDVSELVITKASMIILNFTVQFIPPTKRGALFQNIYQGMQPGGIVVLSEKIQYSDIGQQARMEEWHQLFKKANGYSELEISQKRTALEQVMQLDTLETHTQRLLNTGFDTVEVWFQYLNFASLLAIKKPA